MAVFLSKKERSRHYRNLRIKFYLLAGVVALTAVLAVYAVFKLPFLQIKKFETSGRVELENVQAAVLKNRLAQFLGVENFLSWPKEINGIAVEKDYFEGVLKLAADLPERFIIWCPSASSGQAPSTDCYWVNRQGVAVEIAPDTEGSAIFKIQDSRETELLVGQKVLSENLFGNLVKIVDDVAKLPMGIAGIGFNAKLQELAVRGARGERIIFSLRFAPSEKAFAYLKEIISSGKLRSSEYVDLTVENRIYLKPR